MLSETSRNCCGCRTTHGPSSSLRLCVKRVWCTPTSPPESRSIDHIEPLFESAHAAGPDDNPELSRLDDEPEFAVVATEPLRAELEPDRLLPAGPERDPLEAGKFPDGTHDASNHVPDVELNDLIALTAA